MYKGIHRQLTLLLLICFALATKGQQTPDCEISSNYIPTIPEHNPIKKVRLILHIFQKNDGSGNFQQTEKDISWIRSQIFREVNSIMANLPPMKLETNSKHIKDSRIRYHLDTILFHQDDFAWDMKCDKHGKASCKISFRFGNELYEKYVASASDLEHKFQAIHLFFGENEKGKGRASGIGDKKWTIITGSYTMYQSKNFWEPAGLIRHELGHNLGLIHTWDTDDYCDDTPRNSGCWNGENCSNNMMDYNAQQAALTACQLGRMHFYLCGKRGNISEALIDDYCTHDGSSIEIWTGDTVHWKAEKYIHGNIRIHKNAVLIVSCLLSLPEYAKITILKNGKLIVDGGTITNVCNANWEGVKIQGKRRHRKNPIKFGYIELLNNGKIINARKKNY